MAIQLFLVAASVLMFASAMEQPDGLVSRDIFRRIDLLEQHHQAEREALRKQNDAVVKEVDRLKELNVEHTNRIAVLEERERTMEQLGKQHEELRQQNDAMVNEVIRLKERDVQHTNRIAVLEARERTMAETIETLVTRTQHGAVVHSKPQREDGNGGKSLTDDGRNGDGEETNGTSEQGAPHPVRGHNRIRQVNSEMTVAFFATMSNHTDHMGHNQPVVYDHVITNIGHAYHPTSGYFYAPVSGVYVFSTTIFTFRESAHFEFAVNGKFMSNMYVGPEDEHQTSSQTVVFNLSQGDEVLVRNVDTDIKLFGDHYVSISGFLLSSNINSVTSQNVG